MKLGFILIIIAVAQSCASQEELTLPKYITQGSGRNECDLNRAINRSFLKFYKEYFRDACGNYSQLVKFNIDSSGNVSAISFDHLLPDNINEFITKALRSTSGQWEKNYKGTRTIVLPIDFNFAERCNTTTQDAGHTLSPAGTNNKVMWMNGLAIQKQDENYIYLSPIKLNGIIACRPLIYYLEEKT